MRLQRQSLILAFVRWLVANAVIVLPIWIFVFGTFHSQVHVSLRSSAPYTLKVADREITGGGSTGLQDVEVYLPPAIHPKDAIYVLTNLQGDAEIEAVSWRAFYVLRCTSASLDKTGDHDWRIGSWSSCFLVNSYSVCLIVIELFLLGLAFIPFVREHSVRSIPIRKVVFAGLLLSVCFCGVLPAQTFLSNRAAFEFSTFEFLREGGLLLAVAFVVMTAGVGVLVWSWGRNVLPLGVGLVLYFYLSTGIMAMDYPVLDGSLEFYQNSTRMIVDVAVLLGCLLLSLFFRRGFYRNFECVVLALFVLLGASLVDVKRSETRIVDGSIPGSYLPYEEIVPNIQFSPTRNVLVFILDSLSSEHLMSSFARHPELKPAYQGFTIYTNNVGMYVYTPTAFAGMMAGRERGAEESIEAYDTLAYTKSSVLSDYVEGGFSVYVCPGGTRSGYSNLSLHAKCTRTKTGGGI